MYFLDTSAVIEILRGSGKGADILDLIAGKPVVITSFTTYEILLGMKREEIEKAFDLLSNLPIINFDREAAIESVRIQKDLAPLGKIIGSVDIFIASLCILNKGILVTLDRDFENIRRLQLKII